MKMKGCKMSEQPAWCATGNVNTVFQQRNLHWLMNKTDELDKRRNHGHECRRKVNLWIEMYVNVRSHK